MCIYIYIKYIVKFSDEEASNEGCIGLRKFEGCGRVENVGEKYWIQLVFFLFISRKLFF